MMWSRKMNSIEFHQTVLAIKFISWLRRLDCEFLDYSDSLPESQKKEERR